MRRKLFATILTLTMVTTMLAGCGGGGGDADKGDGGGSDGEKIVIQLAHVEPEDRSLHKGAVIFKNYVEKNTDGNIEVNILSNSSFGGDRQAVEGTALGTIQMTAALTSVLTSYNDDFMILDLPFVFNNKKATYLALDGDLGKALNDLLPENGLIGLGYDDNGLRHVTNSKKPINEPNDLKGIKIRVVESPVYIDTFKLLGANPTPMSFNEVYTALQQGTVDAEENPYGLVYTSKFYEVQKYMSTTGHIASFNAILVNKDFWEGLSDDYKKVIQDGVQLGLIDGQRWMEAVDDGICRSNLEAAGMQINDISPENMQKFKDAVAPLIEDYKGTKVREELFDMVDAANKAAEEAGGDADITTTPASIEGAMEYTEGLEI